MTMTPALLMFKVEEDNSFTTPSSNKLNNFKDNLTAESYGISGFPINGKYYLNFRKET